MNEEGKSFYSGASWKVYSGGVRLHGGIDANWGILASKARKVKEALVESGALSPYVLEDGRLMKAENCVYGVTVNYLQSSTGGVPVVELKFEDTADINKFIRNDKRYYAKYLTGEAEKAEKVNPLLSDKYREAKVAILSRLEKIRGSR